MLNVKAKDGANLKLVTILPIPKIAGKPDLLFVCTDKDGVIHKLTESEVESVGK